MPDSDSEVAMARSAAPASVSDGAEVGAGTRRVQDDGEWQRWFSVSSSDHRAPPPMIRTFGIPRSVPHYFNSPAARTFLPFFLSHGSGRPNQLNLAFDQLE